MREFTRVDGVDVLRHAEQFALRDSRNVDVVHLHHTFRPTVEQFHSLVARLGSNEAAGIELCRRLWRVHTEIHGWRDIAQHITIDPAGGIWLCRPWALPPASARGFNGNETTGPLMIVMMGDFDESLETMSTAQRDAMLRTIGSVQIAFDLDREAVRFHSELNSGKACPGATFDKADLLAGLDRERDAIGASTSFAQERARPFGDLGIASSDVHTRGKAAPLSDTELAAELDESSMSPRALSLLTGLPGARAEASDSAQRGLSLGITDAMKKAVRPHVVNLRKGRLSDSGAISTSKADLKVLVRTHLSDWVAKQVARGITPRVMIYAHGGLNKERSGIRYVHATFKWWKSRGVYPIYFVWETGALDSFLQVTEQAMEEEASRGLLDDLGSWLVERTDAALEALARNFKPNPWDVMKDAAVIAASDIPDAGARLLARELKRLVKAHKTPIEFNAIGHSAGAILQAYFLDRCLRGKNRLHIHTLSLLAPACTVDLFNDLLAGKLHTGTIDHLNLFCLSREAELDDKSLRIYRKSLLHLVSKGFEKHKRGVALLGMQEAHDEDGALKRQLGLSGPERTDISVIYAPTASSAEPLHASTAEVHGAFDNDEPTMLSIARRIVRSASVEGTPWPVGASWTAARGGGDEGVLPLSRALESDTYRALFDRTQNRLNSSFIPSAAPLNNVSWPRGVMRALCVGVDDYPGGNALTGCQNDARAWTSTLRKLGFQTECLLDPQTSFDGILDALRTLVSGASKGDLLVFQYAGHGVQFADTDGDEEDRADEAIVPRELSGERLISDDELWELLESVPDGVGLSVFMDCCHSFSNTRMYGLRSGQRRRVIKPSAAMRAAHRARLDARRSGSASEPRSNRNQRHIKFAACKDTEYAIEENGQGKFTGAALSVLSNLTSPISNAEFLDRVAVSFTPGADQTPGIDCRPEFRSRPFLGGLVMQN